MNLKSRAEAIVKTHLARTDWVDVGSDECFVCGTPLSKELFAKRSEIIVAAITDALEAVYDEAYARGQENKASCVCTATDNKYKSRR